MVRWSKGGSHKGLGMLRLAMRVGTTAPSSPASLVRLSLMMAGLEQLQVVPKRFWPCKLFMSHPLVNTCEVLHTRISMQEYDRRERASSRNAVSIPQSGTRRSAHTPPAAACQICCQGMRFDCGADQR